jgi:MAP kinase interacting serine/threonine kinase
MVLQSSSTFSEVDPSMLLAVEAGPPQGIDPVGSTSTRRKKRRAAGAMVKKFNDLYVSTGEVLGEGSFGQVKTYKNISTGKEYAVKVVEKKMRHDRQKVLKEIEIFHYCQGHENILQLIEFYEEENWFYVVFEKMEGGTLLDTILKRGHLTEKEASVIIRDIARALSFLHKMGIAHRDLKPENILCVKPDQLTPVKMCDFDLGSGIHLDYENSSRFITTPELLSPVGSADFMAPEVVDVWLDRGWSYDKRCDLWSLGIILYILLCGYRPFYASCGKGCGFREGQPCDDCQEMLFQCIQDGEFSFPETEWGEISVEARDLVQRLLVRDPQKRYTADQVLEHQWIHMQEMLPRSQLATPHILSRTNSVRELGLFAENANAVNRLIQRHMSINEVRTHSTRDALRDDDDVDYDNDYTAAAVDNDVAFLEVPMFQLGMLDDDGEDDHGLGVWSEDESDRSMSILVSSCSWKGVSLPGSSKLARRRQGLRHRPSVDSIDSGHVSGCSPPNTGFSPVL